MCGLFNGEDTSISHQGIWFDSHTGDLSELILTLHFNVERDGILLQAWYSWLANYIDIKSPVYCVFGIAVAVHHRLLWFIHIRAYGLWEGDEHPPTLLTGTLYFTIVLCVLCRLLKKDGALLAYAGFDSKDARVTAAIACNVWASFEKNTQPTDDPLNLVCMECEVLHLHFCHRINWVFMHNVQRNHLVFRYDSTDSPDCYRYFWAYLFLLCGSYFFPLLVAGSMR